ncbi:MAG: hypothetical protein HKP18_12805 [Acidimicrobiia bacterium]|nr:hypothetical protein [Acidimicrobiia bacterium]
MESRSRHPVVAWVLQGAVAVVALLVIGSLAYWWADGSPGTPEDFRDRVSATGLQVAWSNSGPRGGSGLVETSCGSLEVSVDDIDDELWIRWSDNREPMTADVVDAVLSCAPR